MFRFLWDLITKDFTMWTPLTTISLKAISIQLVEWRDPQTINNGDLQHVLETKKRRQARFCYSTCFRNRQKRLRRHPSAMVHGIHVTSAESHTSIPELHQSGQQWSLQRTSAEETKMNDSGKVSHTSPKNSILRKYMTSGLGVIPRVIVDMAASWQTVTRMCLGIPYLCPNSLPSVALSWLKI